MEVHMWQGERDLPFSVQHAALKRLLFEDDWDCYDPTSVLDAGNPRSVFSDLQQTITDSCLRSDDAKVWESVAIDMDEVLQPSSYRSSGVSEWGAFGGNMAFEEWCNDDGCANVVVEPNSQALYGVGSETSFFSMKGSSPVSSLSSEADACSHLAVSGEDFSSIAFFDNENLPTACNPTLLQSNLQSEYENNASILQSCKDEVHLPSVKLRTNQEEKSSRSSRLNVEVLSSLQSGIQASAQVEQTSNQGVQSAQLVLSAAEAVACRDKQRAAAYLKELKRWTCPQGDSMQRLTCYFLEGLTARLASFESPQLHPSASRKPIPDKDKQEAFELVYRFCPYISFGHYVANQSILQAFEGESMVHIVDLGMANGLQWPSLLQELALRPGGPPRRVRITAVGSSSPSVKESGIHLTKVAESLHIRFEFRIVTEAVESIQQNLLDMRSGEALAINSIFQLHCVVKESRRSLKSVLQSIRELSPKVLTIVEQDTWHNGPFFLGRFMEALHFYAAIFDSMDEILPRSSPERLKMEQLYFAPEIMNIIACEGPERVERHERSDQWRRRLSRSGFQAKPLKFLMQARKCLAMSFPCSGYTLVEEKGCFILGWKGKPIISASSWRS
ncbi:hypothetical protein O6H91_09G069200 [Diphasiastrum complanatum]|uniref:Uncharacterized protein n=1 Tax=Diphasiastrum complanatum TaxID=34168 RepID=A0ACC2CQ89_DIPCM|nr:hypothetical protein O6H91_09G069200 [Diphasiastrum complanatum]